ncbi:hypothetical protein Mal52_13430 [Symmachiella dynata]|uniref:Replication-relaxation n=1 Tax=Symmachiella dynata TaxID=2527995 RepID=A0A517ZK51_9PLAN|nr:replication-relaxation family protein [Symmachiella dynata]QDU42874.1 hypothetical protein Mal52_13430 [Symmachiella dynata]
MASSSHRWQKTERDDEILAALDLCPLEYRDLLALSETFSRPFGSLDRVRRTLKRLEAAGQVRSWRYATTSASGGASPLYYKLTPEGYRTLHGDDDAVPPTKRYLQETSPGRHQHQQFLTQFTVKTHVAAHRLGLPIVESFPENTYKMETQHGPIFPDRRFTLVIPPVTSLTYCIELDNSTETIVSRKSTDTIEMKICRYLADLRSCDYSYRVLFVVTGAKQRMQNILSVIRENEPFVDFHPFYVVQLEHFLRSENPFFDPIFAHPRNARIALLRSHAESIFSIEPPKAPLVRPLGV